MTTSPTPAPSPAPGAAPQSGTPAPQPPAKKGGSAKWFVLGGAGCLTVIFGLCLITGVVFFLLSRNSLSNKFQNDRAKLNARLQPDYVPFSFGYPGDWQLKTDGSKPDDKNFADVQKVSKDGATETILQDFAVGSLGGSAESSIDVAMYPQLASILTTELAQGFKNFADEGHGSSKVNGYDAYDVFFSGMDMVDGPPQKVFGRVIFLSGSNVGLKNGLIVTIMATEKDKSVTNAKQLGAEGDSAKILSSLKMGN